RRDRAIGPGRKLLFVDAERQTRAALAALEAKGLLRRPTNPTEGDREGLVNEAAMTVTSRVDEVLRDLAMLRLTEFRPELGRALVGEAIDRLLDRLDPVALARRPTSAERSALVESLAAAFGERLATEGLPEDVPALINDAGRRLITLGALRDRPDLLNPPPKPLEQLTEAAGDVLGFARPGLFRRLADHLAGNHEHRLEERIKA